jgi:hypothetical protein
MWEITIQHKYCGMQEVIFGYDFYDACKRANLKPEVWAVIRRVYAD